jgi:hypothetical protein
MSWNGGFDGGNVTCTNCMLLRVAIMKWTRHGVKGSDSIKDVQ